MTSPASQSLAARSSAAAIPHDSPPRKAPGRIPDHPPPTPNHPPLAAAPPEFLTRVDPKNESSPWAVLTHVHGLDQPLVQLVLPEQPEVCVCVGGGGQEQAGLSVY